MLENNILFLCYIFVIGVCIGSFLNVVIYRVPRNLSFILGRSFCPHCHTTIRMVDLIPILSWLILKGKCRSCQHNISWRYPFMELLSGCLAIFCVVYFGGNLEAFLTYVFMMVLLAIAYIDLDTMYIYDRMLIVLFLVEVCMMILSGDQSFIDAILGSLLVSLPMYLLNILIMDCFGGGDIKLMAVVGFLLGYKAILVAFLFAILSGGGYASYLYLRKKVDRKSHIAFAPFLCVGSMVAVFYGELLFQCYIDLWTI